MKKILPTIISIIVLIVILWIMYTIEFISWDFRNNLWAPAYLVVHGESAYNIAIMFDNSNSIWFPQVIGLFFLLGFLPQYLATNVWLILNITLLLTLTWYLFQGSNQVKPKPFLFGVLVIAVFLFPPTIRHLILGQVDILLMVAIIAGVFAIEKKQLVLAGFLFAVALVKPQHCILVLPSVGVYLLLYKRALRDTLKLFLSTCFFIVILTIPLWLSSSNWFMDFLSSLQRNPNWSQPNVFSLLHNKFGVWGFIFWLLLYIVILILSLQIWAKSEPQKAVLWSLALTAIVSPYLWSWDFVFLLPLFVDTAVGLSNLFSRLTLSFFYIACFTFSLIALQGGTASDNVLWWLPIVLVIGITASIKINHYVAKNYCYSKNAT